MMPEIGARVRVRIKRPETYASGAAANLDGKPGIVAELTPESDAWGRPRGDRRALVRFDSPANPWWAHQRPVAAFWFAPSELSPE